MDSEMQFLLVGVWFGVVLYSWAELLLSRSSRTCSAKISISKEKRGGLRGIRNLDPSNYNATDWGF